MDHQLRIVAYDISSDARRRRLEKWVGRFVERMQYSVFEGMLTDAEVARLLRGAARYVLPPDDSLRVYSLCEACREKVQGIGDAPPEDAEEVVV